MSSQSQRQKKIIDEYERRPIYDIKVLNHMKLIHQYSNTVDDEAFKEARQLLNKKENSND